MSNAASQHLRPPINPLTTNVVTPQGLVMVIHIAPGSNRPYVDRQGRIWVKSGSDKRQVTAREEMQRLFQQSGLVYADEVPVTNVDLDDLDLVAFGEYFQRRYHKTVESTGLPLLRLLRNLNLASHSALNLAGWLLFAKAPQSYKPAFLIKAGDISRFG